MKYCTVNYINILILQIAKELKLNKLVIIIKLLNLFHHKMVLFTKIKIYLY